MEVENESENDKPGMLTLFLIFVFLVFFNILGCSTTGIVKGSVYMYVSRMPCS